MKLRLLTATVVSVALISSAFALELSNQTDKFSYTLGNQLGKTMHQQDVPLNTEVYMQGLKDGLGDKKPLLTQQEQQAVMQKVQDELRKKMEQKMAVEAKENTKKGEAFLAENKNKPDVKVLKDGLQYKIIKEGKGKKPTEKETVTVNYEGKLIDGKVFDSSYQRGTPATFPVNGVIKGWTEALQMMPVGSTWELFVPADLAYGDKALPGIPPSSVLIFKVELLSIDEKK